METHRDPALNVCTVQRYMVNRDQVGRRRSRVITLDLRVWAPRRYDGYYDLLTVRRTRSFAVDMMVVFQPDSTPAGIEVRAEYQMHASLTADRYL